jgi:hypothetical protein
MVLRAALKAIARHRCKRLHARYHAGWLKRLTAAPCFCWPARVASVLKNLRASHFIPETDPTRHLVARQRWRLRSRTSFRDVRLGTSVLIAIVWHVSAVAGAAQSADRFT